MRGWGRGGGLRWGWWRWRGGGFGCFVSGMRFVGALKGFLAAAALFSAFSAAAEEVVEEGGWAVCLSRTPWKARLSPMVKEMKSTVARARRDVRCIVPHMRQHARSWAFENRGSGYVPRANLTPRDSLVDTMGAKFFAL